MIIIKDLGITTLDGKLTKARRYFEVECPICHKRTVKRLDQLAQEYCVSCTRKLQARELRTLAQQAIEHNENILLAFRREFLSDPVVRENIAKITTEISLWLLITQLLRPLISSSADDDKKNKLK